MFSAGSSSRGLFPQSPLSPCGGGRAGGAIDPRFRVEAARAIMLPRVVVAGHWRKESTVDAFADSAHVPIVVQCGDGIWQSLLVWLSAVVASWGAVFIQNRLERRKAHEERRMAVLSDAYIKMKHIQSALDQDTDANVEIFMKENDTWLFSNVLWLPRGYADLWLSIRDAIKRCVRVQTAFAAGRPAAWTPAQLTRVQLQMNKWAEQALLTVYDCTPGVTPLKPLAADPGPPHDDAV